ncbi:hypothetical protein F5888DRAFT_1636319 [Russula emetica]|nr:hypothetical protein F5888DRAFT_1636319 [Russula emetica]
MCILSLHTLASVSSSSSMIKSTKIPLVTFPSPRMPPDTGSIMPTPIRQRKCSAGLEWALIRDVQYGRWPEKNIISTIPDNPEEATFFKILIDVVGLVVCRIGLLAVSTNSREFEQGPVFPESIAGTSGSERERDTVGIGTGIGVMWSIILVAGIFKFLPALFPLSKVSQASMVLITKLTFKEKVLLLLKCPFPRRNIDFVLGEIHGRRRWWAVGKRKKRLP